MELFNIFMPGDFLRQYVYTISKMLRVRRRHHMHGSGKVMDFLKKAYNYVKNNKLVSRGLSQLAPHAGAYAPLVSGIGSVAGHLGFGRRLHRRYGGALRLAGSARRRSGRKHRY